MILVYKKKKILMLFVLDF